MKLFPSILSADFGCLSKDLDSVTDVVDQLHLDVMDGHFVPNISFGPPVIERVSDAYPEVNLDAHLMISNPAKYFEDFVRIGMDWVSVHLEVDPDIKYLRREADKHDVGLGLALNPSTSVADVDGVLQYADYVVAMTVKPGFSGQSFREDVLTKVRRLGKAFEGPIQVDGGIGPETIEAAAEAGAEWFVSGSSVFGKNNPASAARDLEQRVEWATG